MATLLRLLGALPLSFLHALGAVLGRLGYRFHSKTRARQNENFSLAAAKFPELRSISALAIASESGKQISEMAWVWRNHWVDIAPYVELDAASQAIMKAPVATIFLTPHLGCFEIAGYCVGALRPFTAMYRKPRIASLDALMRAGRKKGQVVCVPADFSGVRAMLRALRRGEAIGILPDQTPTEGEGVWVPLFGKPAYTMTLIATLAEKTKARLVMVTAERLPSRLGSRVRFKVNALALPALPAAHPDNPHAGTVALNALVEAAIAANPTQYLWSYNRYKRPGGAPPPSE